MFSYKFDNSSAILRLMMSFELRVQIGYLCRYFVKRKKVEQIFNVCKSHPELCFQSTEFANFQFIRVCKNLPERCNVKDVGEAKVLKVLSKFPKYLGWLK